jgi:hypothetical protein
LSEKRKRGDGFAAGWERQIIAVVVVRKWESREVGGIPTERLFHNLLGLSAAAATMRGL